MFEHFFFMHFYTFFSLTIIFADKITKSRLIELEIFISVRIIAIQRRFQPMSRNLYF